MIAVRSAANRRCSIVVPQALRTPSIIALLCFLPLACATAEEDDPAGKTVLVKVSGTYVKVGKKPIVFVTRGQEMTVLKRTMLKGRAWLGVKWTADEELEKKGWILESKIVFRSELKPRTDVPEVTPTVDPAKTRPVEKLVKVFIESDDDERADVYAELEKTGRIDKFLEAVKPGALALANDYFRALRERGREGTLLEHYAPAYVKVCGDEVKAIRQQEGDEDLAADYSGIWGQHAYLLDTGILVGLKPKNSKILAAMEEAQPDRHGTPGWVKTGATLILTPIDGEWKVLTTRQMAYARNMTKWLRRQEEEAREKGGN